MKKHRKVQRMDMDLYKRLIKEIAAENPDARVWLIFFGEPALDPDMPERIKYAKDSGLTDVVLNSNGQLLKSEISKSYIESGLDAMYVGIDAYYPATYSKIRIGKKAQLHTAITNVVQYKAWRDAVGTEDQHIFVQFVVDDINKKELHLFKDFWKDMKVNVKIRPKASWAGLIDAQYSKADRKRVRKPCLWLMQTMVICADGKIALCACDVHNRVPGLGDSTKNMLKGIWKSGQLKFYRSYHLKEQWDSLPDMCKNCHDWMSAYSEYQEV